MKKRIVNRYPNIDTFGSRLIYLYDNAGLLVNGAINFSRVANDLYSMGLREYSYTADNNTKHNQTKNTADTLRKHIDRDSAENVSGDWLNIYCKFFRCSCDFLMGYIDLPLHENTSISVHTGLSDKAIRKLNRHKKRKDKDDFDKNILFALNRLFDSKMGESVLLWIALYLDTSEIKGYIHDGQKTLFIEDTGELDANGKEKIIHHDLYVYDGNDNPLMIDQDVIREALKKKIINALDHIDGI